MLKWFQWIKYEWCLNTVSHMNLHFLHICLTTQSSQLLLCVPFEVEQHFSYLILSRFFQYHINFFRISIYELHRIDITLSLISIKMFHLSKHSLLPVIRIKVELNMQSQTHYVSWVVRYAYECEHDCKKKRLKFWYWRGWFRISKGLDQVCR